MMLTLLRGPDSVTLVVHPMLWDKLAHDHDNHLPDTAGDLVTVREDADPLDRFEAELVTSTARAAVEAAIEARNGMVSNLLERVTSNRDGARVLTLTLPETSVLATWANAKFVSLRRTEMEDVGFSTDTGPATPLDELAALLGESAQPEMNPDTGMWAQLAATLATAAL